MKNILGVEIFKVGVHKGRRFSIGDLRSLVDAFNKLDFKPPVKLGHQWRDANQPEPMAAGWVENVRLSGETIVADLVDLPDEVYDAIRQRRYDNVSAEIAFNMERNGKVYEKALTALALLGINLPAVAGLKPLHKHFDFAFLKEVEGEAYNVELPADSGQAIYVELPVGISADKMREAIQSLSTHEEDMDKEEAQKLAAEAAKAAAEATEKKLREEFEAKMKTETEARQAAEKKLQDQQEAFAAEQRRAASVAFADRCVMPALRPMIVALHSVASKAPATETFDVGLGADKKVDSIGALNTLIETINGAAKKKLFAVDTQVGGKPADRGGAEYDVTDKKSVNDHVAKLVAEFQAKPENKGVSYDDALITVLNGDAELKQAYAA